MRPEEVRDMGDADIAQMIEQIKDELFELRMKGAYEELENSAKIGRMRRDIARLKTIQHERARSAARQAKGS